MPPLRRPGTDREAEFPEYAGQYRLERRLGSGGMGVVHLSRSTSGLRLAVKVVHQELAADPEFRARFRQEVAAARRVSGAFTAPVVDADPDAERPWMATLYMPGPTLAEFVKRNGPVSPAQVRYLMAGLAEALRDIHRVGVVHRDLKPSNVLLASDGPKVIDFGISRPSDSDLRTETGKLIGTPPFMAPEQFRQPRSVGPAADIFAMGSVLVHAATGRSPFDSDSPYVVAYQVVHEEPHLTGVPADLRPLIERCLAKNPEERPAPDALMAELRAVSASYNTQAFTLLEEGDLFLPAQRPPGADERIDRAGLPKRSREHTAGRFANRQRQALAAGVALALLGTGAVLAVQRHAGRDGGETTASHSAIGPETKRFTPWHSVLRNDASTTAMPACSYSGRALYCAQPGVLAAKLDPASGLLQWSRRVATDGSTDEPSTAPLLSGDVLHAHIARRNRLEAIDSSTGKTWWDLDLSPYNGRFLDTGAQILLVSPGAVVTAVDGLTGTKKWRKPLPGHSQPIFTVDRASDVIYAIEVAGDGNTTLVTALNPNDGDRRGQKRLTGNLSPIGVVDGSVYFSVSDAESRTTAIVRYTPGAGTLQRIRLGVPLPGARIAVQGSRVYAIGYNGALVSVDTDGTGGEDAERWTVETSVSYASPPVVDGDHLFFVAADGRLLAFHTADGRFLGQTPPRMNGNRSRQVLDPPAPVVADGKVFATAPDGSVFAVDAKDPSRW
ncbi:serine/threonine-protein kinase [Actinacidiphila sp. bgisy160]|uniref:serine/threonine-protein kinase n=1 Tax=Actinacidiphila sp. bgisy160 TaxID=3413796 RepID=UPI003D743F14